MSSLECHYIYKMTSGATDIRHGLPNFGKFLQPNPLRYGHELFREDS